MAIAPWIKLGKILQEAVKANAKGDVKDSSKKESKKSNADALEAGKMSISPAINNKFLQVLPSNKEAAKLKEEAEKKKALEKEKELKKLPQPKPKKEVYKLRETPQEALYRQGGEAIGDAFGAGKSALDFLGTGISAAGKTYSDMADIVVGGVSSVFGGKKGKTIEKLQKDYKGSKDYVKNKGLAGVGMDVLGGVGNMVAGAASELPNATGNILKFGTDVAATLTDLVEAHSPGNIKSALTKRIKEMEAKGEEVSPELYKLANQRGGDIFRYAGVVAETLGSTGKQHGSDVSEALGADPDSLGFKTGAMGLDMAITALLSKKFNLNQLPKLLTKGEKIKEGINLGKQWIKGSPSLIKNATKSVLDQVSNNVPQFSKLFANSAMNTAIFDAVSKGETNAGSILLGFLTDKYFQKTSRALGDTSKMQYAKSLPDMIPEEKGLATVLAQHYKDVTEYGLKQGWSGSNVDSFAANLGKEAEIALGKADDILSKSNATLKENDIVGELLEQSEKMAKEGLVTDASAMLSLYDKRIAPLVKDGILGVKSLKEIKQGLNKLLKPIADPSVVGPRQAEEIQYALTMKKIVDGKLNNLLGEKWAALNKDAFTANQLKDIAELRRTKIQNDQVNQLARNTVDTSNKSGAAMVSQAGSQIASSLTARLTTKAGRDVVTSPITGDTTAETSTSINSVDELKAYIQTLSPEEKEALKQSMLQQAPMR